MFPQPKFKGRGMLQALACNKRPEPATSPRQAPSPSSLLQQAPAKLQVFLGRAAGGCLGCAPQAGLAGATRVLTAWVRGSPGLAQQPQNRWKLYYLVPAGTTAHAARPAVPPASQEQPRAQGRTWGSRQARARGRLCPDI